MAATDGIDGQVATSVPLAATGAAAPAAAAGTKHELHRSDYVQRMESFWEDQLAAASGQSATATAGTAEQQRR